MWGGPASCALGLEGGFGHSTDANKGSRSTSAYSSTSLQCLKKRFHVILSGNWYSVANLPVGPGYFLELQLNFRLQRSVGLNLTAASKGRLHAITSLLNSLPWLCPQISMWSWQP